MQPKDLITHSQSARPLELGHNHPVNGVNYTDNYLEWSTR
jgi:hypothetical protein